MADRIHLSAPGCLLGAVLLMLLPLRWLLAMGAAAMLHELGHLIGLWLLGARVLELRIGAYGMVMETEALGYRQELWAAAAGPGISLALVLLWRWLPRLAICGMVQGLYNLLPLYPLDGGRMLRCTLGRTEKGEKVCRIAECSFLGVLGIGILAGSIILRTGIIPLLLMLTLVLRCVRFDSLWKQ